MTDELMELELIEKKLYPTTMSYCVGYSDVPDSRFRLNECNVEAAVISCKEVTQKKLAAVFPELDNITEMVNEFVDRLKSKYTTKMNNT
jgi:hypothetical protein